MQKKNKRRAAAFVFLASINEQMPAKQAKKRESAICELNAMKQRIVKQKKRDLRVKRNETTHCKAKKARKRDLRVERLVRTILRNIRD